MKQATPHLINIIVSTQTLRYLQSYRRYAISAESYGIDDPRTAKVLRRCMALAKLCPVQEAGMLDELGDLVTSARRVVFDCEE